MKRKSFIAIALVLAVLGLSACEDEVVPDSQFSFNATLEGLSASDDSKVYLLNEQWIYWELGDQISIGSDVYASSNYVGDLINTGAPDWEDFNGVFISSLPWSSKYFVGLYPYSENNQISKSGGAGTSTGFSASIELPSVQSFRRSNAGGHNGDYTFNKNVYPMVALYDGHWDEAAGSVAYNLDFHALAGIVRLQFYDATGSTGKAIRRITVSSPDKQLCGMFNVKEIYTPQPYLEATNNSANRTVTLDCGEDGRVFDSLCSFYLVLPALGNSGTTTSYALSVTLETTDGESCTKNITSVPVRRTGITFMRALSIDSWSPVTASQRLVGNGTKERPYKVYTAADLRYLRDCYNADTVAGTPPHHQRSPHHRPHLHQHHAHRHRPLLLLERPRLLELRHQELRRTHDRQVQQCRQLRRHHQQQQLSPLCQHQVRRRGDGPHRQVVHLLQQHGRLLALL